MRTRFVTSSAWLAMYLGMSAPASGDVDFARDVRPILAGHCYKCHGPDAEQRQANLRLDARESAIAEADSGELPIVPGKPDESELVRRILSDDESEQMPPPDANLILSPAQKEILKQWIAEGAVYQPHWAFVAPQAAALPDVADVSWPRNPIDRFVLSKLESENLQRSPEADRYHLIRRLSLDLIGLLPTAEEIDAFVADERPGAYERLVDRLLASPHYGERWARRWLDLARYADTNGYEKDRPRSIWPYRDWVIDAVNSDMPFDQFTIEQLAGDMLPSATLAQHIATGFHRNTMINEEGGIDPLEFRFHAMTDRVNTTATTWLGLTMGCAQCHTHKYDPIQQREYYQVMAFLNNADEPEMEAPSLMQIALRRNLQAEVVSRQNRMFQRYFVDQPVASNETPWAARSRPFQKWLREEQQRAVDWTILRPVTAKSDLPRLEILNDDSILASGDQTKRDEYRLTFAGDFSGVTAIRLEALPHESLPRNGPGRAYYEGPKGDFFLSEVFLKSDAEHRIEIASATETYAKLGIGSGGSSAALALDGNFHTGWSVNEGEGQPHTAVFNLRQPLATAQKLQLTLIFERHYPAGLGRFRIAVTRDTREITASKVPVDVEASLLSPFGKLTAAQQRRVKTYYVSIAPELDNERKAIEKLHKSLPEIPRTLVMQERPLDFPRPTYFHKRGEFLQPTETVDPDVPAFLHSFPTDRPRNRLEFARWLVNSENPLTARVIINRHWAAFFGRGIVGTLDDFGTQGDLPTHPELLDWLALEFIKQGWSTKSMHRLIVTSATYRQSSRVTPQLIEADPENRLLARGPRFRMEAELVRDAVLCASGLLSDKIGGPSVFPPQPATVTTEDAFGKLQWKVSEGEDRYRRGLYTFMKRTTPYAMLSMFDGPSGEACVAKREVSNSPLQALTLLNDAVFLETAQRLGAWAATQSGPPQLVLDDLFRRCLTRPPDTVERDALLAFYTRQQTRFAKRQDAALALAGDGKKSNAAERAAWTSVSRAILNLDEMITKN